MYSFRRKFFALGFCPQGGAKSLDFSVEFTSVSMVYGRQRSTGAVFLQAPRNITANFHSMKAAC